MKRILCQECNRERLYMPGKVFIPPSSSRPARMTDACTTCVIRLQAAVCGFGPLTERVDLSFVTIRSRGLRLGKAKKGAVLNVKQRSLRGVNTAYWPGLDVVVEDYKGRAVLGTIIALEGTSIYEDGVHLWADLFRVRVKEVWGSPEERDRELQRYLDATAEVLLTAKREG